MDLKKDLDILLITYNRKIPLKTMLECIFSEDSPIKECSLTVLDNHSDDGTSELLAKYTKQHPNIKHIRHRYNVGGDANLVKALEIADSAKKYCWFLCDDDYLDWTHWGRIQGALNSDKYDIIQVGSPAHMDLTTENQKERLGMKLIQMTWIPSVIYRADRIDSDVITNAYFSVCMLFPIMALTFSIINNDGLVFLTDAAETILYQPTYKHSGSYTRGLGVSPTLLPKRARIDWQTGYSEVLGMLRDPELKAYCVKHFATHGTATYNGFLSYYIPYAIEKEYWDNFIPIYHAANAEQKDKFYDLLYAFKRNSEIAAAARGEVLVPAQSLKTRVLNSIGIKNALKQLIFSLIKKGISILDGNSKGRK